MIALAAIAAIAAAADQPGASLPADASRVTVNVPGFASLTALGLAALLLLLSVYRRRPYILQWAAAWLFLAVTLFLVSREPTSPLVARLLAGVAQFLFVCSSLLFVVSADHFRQRPRLGVRYLAWLLPLAIWFLLAPLALEPWAVLVPGHLIAAAGLAAAGVGFLVIARQTTLLGAALLGATFLLASAANVWVSLVFAGLAAGSPFPVLAATAVLFLLAAFGMHLLVFEDMTYELRRANRRLEAAQAELRQLVITDALTGCYNRRFFDEVIGREIQRHRRYGIPLSILFVDVDRFKAVNDALGHAAGDRLLQHVAAFLRRHVREADYVFRWGGDEFLLLLTCSEAEAARKGRDLKARFAQSPEVAALPDGVGLSVGCAAVPDDVDDVGRIVRIADERMYRDKARAGA
jgi:diguanylate cyclase (GGDEF)-like protein